MSSIGILLQSIISSYFTNSHCLILISEKQSSLILKPKIPLLKINLNGSQNLNNMFNYIGCQELILEVENPVTLFRLIEKQFKLHQDRFNHRKYIFVSSEIQMENCLNIFETKEIQYVTDVLIILKEQSVITKHPLLETHSEAYSLWTHKYVGNTDTSKVYFLNKWFSSNNSFVFNNSLFPDKLKDQEGKKLRTAVFSYEPYVIIEQKSDQNYMYMGSEMMTMLMFAQYHNMTMFPVVNELDYWGEIWNNWSGNGLMGNLVKDEADIGAAALYTWESAYHFLDLSKPTVRTGVTCLVPAPKLAAGWLTPAYAYSSKTWFAVMGTFVLSVLTLYLLSMLQITSEATLRAKSLNSVCKIQEFGKVLISVFKPFVMQNVTINEIARGLLGRYTMGLIFMTTLILSSTYNSSLATIMTIPRYSNPIDTVNDFIASNISWGGTQEGWILSIADAKEPNLVDLVSRFVGTSEENLRQYSLSGEFAFAVERLPNNNYAVGTYIQEDVIQNFHLMTEDFYWEFCVLMLRKNSILLPHVDMFVLKAVEAGLISFWQNQAATEYMNQYVQKLVKYFSHHQKERGIVKLKMKHVLGPFAILAFGNGVAFGVFLMELMYYRLFEKDTYIE